MQFIKSIKPLEGIQTQSFYDNKTGLYEYQKDIIKQVEKCGAFFAFGARRIGLSYTLKKYAVKKMLKNAFSSCTFIVPNPSMLQCSIKGLTDQLLDTAPNIIDSMGKSHIKLFNGSTIEYVAGNANSITGRAYGEYVCADNIELMDEETIVTMICSATKTRKYLFASSCVPHPTLGDLSKYFGSVVLDNTLPVKVRHYPWHCTGKDENFKNHIIGQHGQSYWNNNFEVNA